MFGKRKRVEKSVERGEGQRAHATILKATKFLPGQGAGDMVQIGGTYRVTVRVEPGYASPYEAHLTMHATHISEEPHEGDRIPVLVSGDDVVWDREEGRREH